MYVIFSSFYCDLQRSEVGSALKNVQHKRLKLLLMKKYHGFLGIGLFLEQRLSKSKGRVKSS